MLFWGVKPFSLVQRHQSFGWIRCLHLQFRRAIPEGTYQPRYPYKMSCHWIPHNSPSLPHILQTPTCIIICEGWEEICRGQFEATIPSFFLI